MLRNQRGVLVARGEGALECLGRQLTRAVDALAEAHHPGLAHEHLGVRPWLRQRSATISLIVLVPQSTAATMATSQSCSVAA